MTDRNILTLGRCPADGFGARALKPVAPKAAPCPGRCGLLGFIGLAGAAGLATKAALAVAAKDERHVQPDRDGTADRQSFYGLHQSGIATAQPAAALVASFDVLADSRMGIIAMMKRLTVRTAALMSGEKPALTDDELPPLHDGPPGAKGMTDNLSMTVAFGTSIFDARFGLAAQRPKRLVVMTAFPNDALDGGRCHGDLLIQFNANTAETNIHALRAVLQEFPDDLALRWKQDGFLPAHTVKAQGRDTARNLLGFKDGNANSAYLMNRFAWVGEASEEPGWVHGGTYQAVRIIRTLVERWDRTSLQEQQAIIGRDKAEGAPLGMAHERDVPDYLGDPEGHGVPLDAHIRRANPRDPASADRLILRRGYTYSNGLTKSGQLDMGLLFTAFQSDLERGVVAVQTRLNGEPLEKFIKPVGGGYFFALPGVQEPRGYLAQALLESHV